MRQFYEKLPELRAIVPAVYFEDGALTALLAQPEGEGEEENGGEGEQDAEAAAAVLAVEKHLAEDDIVVVRPLSPLPPPPPSLSLSLSFSLIALSPSD
eukprot:COSAG05_NODE_2843_length_2581_cov_1.765915_5_plen_98_part_00